MPARLPALKLAALAVLAVLPALTANAQPGVSATPESAAPSFRSALEGYQPFSDEKVLPWREANDNVGRIGGWRVYAREAQEGADSSNAAPARPASGTAGAKPADPAPVPANPHLGHNKQ